MARRLMHRASLDKSMDPLHSNGTAGIHVHTSNSDWSNYETHINFTKILFMLNRKSSEEFIYNFSGREDHDYYEQSESLCWDDYNNELPDETQEDTMLERQMVRNNSFCGKYTIEYRIWDSAQDRLLPAIDFAHACTKFIATVKPEGIPYLTQFKDWVETQRGYKTLKTDHSWSYI